MVYNVNIIYVVCIVYIVYFIYMVCIANLIYLVYSDCIVYHVYIACKFYIAFNTDTFFSLYTLYALCTSYMHFICLWYRSYNSFYKQDCVQVDQFENSTCTRKAGRPDTVPNILTIRLVSGF